MRFRVLPLAVLTAALLVASSSSAQLGKTVVTESTEEAFVDLSSVVEAELRLGSDFNIRIGPAKELGDTAGPKRSFLFLNGVPVPFSLQFSPPGGGNKPSRYEFTVEGQKLVEISRGTENKDVDLVIVRAESNVAGASLVMDEIQLAVPPGSGLGGFTEETASADGDGDTVQVVTISGPDLRLGFTLNAQITFFSEEPLPADAEVSLRLRTQRDDDIALDSDRDGVLNEDDNCPTEPNSDQADFDDDGVGDVCDNCPVEPNADQFDPDNDGFGEPCDNCPSDCTPATSYGFASCQNEDQANSDGGTRGDACDNCPTKLNEDQADTDGNGIGNKCENFAADLETQGGESAFAELIPSPESFIMASSSEVSNAVTAGDAAFDIKFTCGSKNVTRANLVIRIPGITTPADVDFGSTLGSVGDGCILQSGLQRRSDCDAATGLGNSIDRFTSETFGPNIFSPPMFDSELYVISLVGNFAAGFEDDVICVADEAPVFIGRLLIANLSSDAGPSLTTAGLELFDPDKPALVDAEEGVVAVQDIVFSSGPKPGEEEFTLALSPALEDVLGFARLQLTLESDAQLINRFAFGLKSPVPLGAASNQMGFGGCSVLNTSDGFEKFSCGEDSDLGPFVLRSTEPSTTPTTYIVLPNTPGAPASLAPHTLYVVLEGRQPVSTSFKLNELGRPSLLGVFEWLNGAEGSGRPSFVFSGVTDLPGVSSVSVSVEGEAIGTTDIRIVSNFDVDGDNDSDLIGNNSDNCVNFPNPLQKNDGTILLVGQDLDMIGNLCTCGDGEENNLDEPGTVFPVDLAACQTALAGAPVDANAKARCSVTGGTELDINDILTLQLRLGEAPGVVIQQVCQPAAVAPSS